LAECCITTPVGVRKDMQGNSRLANAENSELRTSLRENKHCSAVAQTRQYTHHSEKVQRTAAPAGAGTASGCRTTSLDIATMPHFKHKSDKHTSIKKASSHGLVLFVSAAVSDQTLLSLAHC
jgi:hypothetical protein